MAKGERLFRVSAIDDSVAVHDQTVDLFELMEESRFGGWERI